MIIIIDTIGNETGMNLYNDAFVSQLKSQGLKSCVLSNYKNTDTEKILYNFYKGKQIKKIVLLLMSYIRVKLFYLKNKQHVFIYHSYGLRIIDILFLTIFWNSNCFYLLVHDVFELSAQAKIDKYKRIKQYIYRKYIPSIIYHSNRTKSELEIMGYKGNLFFVPHFSFTFPKDVVDIRKVGNEIINAIDNNKINYLYFGQISLLKGIDVLIDSFTYLNSSDFSYNIIIAGEDKRNLLDGKYFPPFVKVINRYISDDELNYLFENIDYVILPYKENYQSGVLEIVVYFRKPAILSKIPYFIDFKEKYNSFCKTFNANDGKSLANMIVALTKGDDNNFYYKAEELEKYQNNRKINFFVDALVSNIKSLNSLNNLYSENLSLK